MLQTVGRWRKELRPQLWKNTVRELGKPGFHEGEGEPPALWHVTGEGNVTLCISVESSTDPETVLIRDYLWQHLQNSDLSWLLNDADRGLPAWKNIGGIELVKRAELMTAIDNSCHKITGYPLLDSINEKGLFLDFSNTISASSIDGIYRKLDYHTKKDPNNKSYIARYGAFIIARSDTLKQAQRYVKWHKKLMDKWQKNRLMQEIVELMQSRERIVLEMERVLVKLSVDGHIQGRCDGCP